MSIETTPVYISPYDLYLFGRGEHWDLYRILGCHPDVQEEKAGYRFGVWAPNARSVSVVGDFNDWKPGVSPLYPVGVSGVWAGFLPGMEKGALYKFAVETINGDTVTKADPFAFYTEVRPAVAAKAWTLDDYEWGDDEWMQARREYGLPLDKPVSIYEVHPGSWSWKGEEYGSFLSYRDMADQLLEYVLDLGFTHIQFMPLAEHPLDESWGYQTSHYFAPTSRFGTPEGLRYLVDRCHQAGVGVIVDWVPGHFPKDEWCLGRFDGTALFEHEDPRRGEHPDWGTYIFNYGRHEVRNFLLSNALYWLKEFHIDGIRIDAVASMLYLDYSREQGDWIPNEHGGRENLDAIQLLQELNKVVHAHFPGAMTAAEESTSWPGVSRPVYTGGLGFTFKWNMGWMNDTLDYFHQDPVYRSYHQNKLTFSMIYAFSENFILPLSHDEVVHGKGSLISKMPGDMWRQFANLRLLLAYQWAHPGKKLLFMGQEFGQWTEWTSRKPLDWVLLQYPNHDSVRQLVRNLNGLLASEPAMHEADNDWSGFEWVDFSDYHASVISFLRKAPDGEPLLWVFNFTPVVRENYCVGCPLPGFWSEVLNTDSEIYSGSNVGNAGGLHALPAEHPGGWPHYLKMTLPPLAAMAFRHEPEGPGA